MKAILAAAVFLEALYALQKVIRSSRSVFAFSLIAFSMLYSGDLVSFMWFGAKVTIPGLYLNAFIAQQSWLFSMKYLQSYLFASGSMTHQRMQVIAKWTVLVIYNLVIILMLLMQWHTMERSLQYLIVDYEMFIKFQKQMVSWFFAQQLIVALLNILNSFITVFAIYNLYKIIVKFSNSNIGLNKLSIALHVFLLACISGLSLMQLVLLFKRYAYYVNDAYYFQAYTQSPEFLAECIVTSLLQLTICYICQTMGSNPQLKNARVVIKQHHNGTVQLVVERINNSGRSTQSLTIDHNESIDSSLQSSFINLVDVSDDFDQTRECDSIMQQFIAGLDEETTEHFPSFAKIIDSID